MLLDVNVVEPWQAFSSSLSDTVSMQSTRKGTSTLPKTAYPKNKKKKKLEVDGIDKQKEEPVHNNVQNPLHNSSKGKKDCTIRKAGVSSLMRS